MHRFKKYLLFPFLFICITCIGQVDPIGAINRSAVENKSGGYLNVGPYKVKGSPYLYGESFVGAIEYSTGKGLLDRKILYNLYDQKAGLEINDLLFEADESIKEFYIKLSDEYGGSKLLFKNSSEFGDKKIKGFFNVLVDGEKAMLLKYFKIRLQPDPVNTLAKDIKVFEQYHEYYLFFKNTQSLKKIKLRKKDLAKEFEDDPYIKTYLSNYPQDLFIETDLINLIKNYNNK
jgi:hypothetical protein